MIYDIFYISDGLINNEKWNTFKSRFPLARKLENVTSYADIRSKAFTKFFWVVWDDLEIVDDFKYEILNCLDSPNQSILQYVDVAIKFINEAIQNNSED